MNIAIMQPYIFPYLGYFQLVDAVDVFVFFDDVQYKRRSYITRNSILINGEPNKFSVPVEKGNREDLINQIELHKTEFENWKSKFLTTLKHAYGKAPYFEKTFNLVEKILKDNVSDIATLTKNSIVKVSHYLNIETEFKSSFNLSYDRNGNGQDKILSICDALKPNTYINAINGRDLYTANAFEENGVELLFLDSNIKSYNQFSADFVSHLSILDMMMFLSPNGIKEHLEDYKLISN